MSSRRSSSGFTTVIPTTPPRSSRWPGWLSGTRISLSPRSCSRKPSHCVLPWPTRHYLRTYETYRQLPQEDLLREISRLCARQIRDLADRLDKDVPAVLVAHVAAARAIYSGSDRSALIGSDPTILTSDEDAVRRQRKMRELRILRDPR